MTCLVDGTNLFFITWSAFTKMMCDKNHDYNYVVQDDDMGLFYYNKLKNSEFFRQITYFKI